MQRMINIQFSRKKYKAMGLLYSLTSYFYPSQTEKLSQAAIKTKAQRLVLFIKQAQYKLQQMTMKLEQDLLKLMSQNPLMRTREGQRIRMQLIIQNSQKMLVYDQLILGLNQIIKEAYMLQTNPTKISNQCIIAINSIIFVYEKLELKEFVNLGEFIPEPHPVISIQRTGPLIQRYLNGKLASRYELNLYACQLAARHGLDLAVFNSVGHQFEANPLEPNEESPSAHMFAITLEDMELEEMPPQENGQHA